MEEVIGYLNSNQARFVDELGELIRIPSVSTQTEHNADVRRCAEAVAESFRKIGMTTTEIHETKRHPVVYSEWCELKDKPTVLIYGHYDVQPEDPVDEWDSPPFEPTIRDNILYGRGTADNKGQFFLHIKAVEAYLKTKGELPVNVKFLIEGEEEIGGPNLAGFIKANLDKLACDVILISDLPMFDHDLPTLFYALRGIVYVEVHLYGPNQDLHSGSYGGAVVNPANALADVLSKLKDSDGCVKIPGFYDAVREPSEKELAIQRSLPFNEQAFCQKLGVQELTGEPGFSPLQRLTVRPTLDICGLHSGYTAEGAKTIIPAHAMAKISMRLVANQDPDDILAKAKAYIESLAPKGVRMEVKDLHGVKPHNESIESQPMVAAADALKQVFGKEAVFAAGGGSISVVRPFTTMLNATCILMGFGTPDQNIHSPNEKLYLSNFSRGMQASAHFLSNMRA